MRLAVVGFGAILVACGGSGADPDSGAPMGQLDGGAGADTGTHITPHPAATPLAGDWFAHQNFIEWHFVSVSGETFDQIRADLDAIEARGTGALLIYAQYHGNPDGYYGAEPIDPFAPFPDAGSMDDFRALVDEAHARNIAVIGWMVFHSIGPDSEIWRKAVRDVQSGVDSEEARAFLFVDRMEDTYDLGVLEGGWAFSAEANKYYATAWNYPAWNFGSPAATALCTRIAEFWLDTGLDGFGYDAPPSEVAHSAADRKALLGDLPVSRGATFRFGEGVEWYDGRTYAEQYNVNFVNFGEDDDTMSIIDQISAGTWEADDLEELLATTRDWAVENGGGTTRLWTYHENDTQYLFGGAVLAGVGVHIDFFHSAEPEDANNWVHFSATRQEAQARLMRAVKQDPAFAPAARRVRVPTGADQQHYAVKRTSLDGTRHGLAVFNFKPTESTVPVDLAGTGIGPQVPGDIYTGAAGPEIAGASYPVTLPGYGFLLLDVVVE